MVLPALYSLFTLDQQSLCVNHLGRQELTSLTPSTEQKHDVWTSGEGPVYLLGNSLYTSMLCTAKVSLSKALNPQLPRWRRNMAAPLL